MQYRIRKLGYKNVVLGSARVYHDVSEGLKKVNEMRLYYIMRSKIIFELDLEPLENKITFFLSLPIYLLHYGNIALKTRGLKGVKIVLEGLFDGLRRAEGLKYVY